MLRFTHWAGSVMLLSVVPCFGQAVDQPVEPNAGTWKTWAISSGKDYRVPPPPDAATTRGELVWLKSAVSESNPYIADSVRFWSAGAPAYQWLELISNRAFAGAPLTAFPHRVYTYVALAMYDATVATWESKYFYNRPRPSQVDATLKPRLPVPHSPSYPSEHAATAAAAAAVLAYFFPAEAASFQAMADEAGKSQLYAGLAFPTDYFAGVDLGKKVAQRIIDLAKGDGSDAVWTGTVPTGKCMWIGANPGNVTAIYFKPFLLASPSEFRPATPPACDSPQMVAEVGIVRDFPRSPAAFATNQRAMYWQKPGRHQLLALRVREQMDVRRQARSEPAPMGTCLRSDRGVFLRCIHCQPGRQIHLLVHPAAPTRSEHNSLVSCPELPELSIESRYFLYYSWRDARLPFPAEGRLRPRTRERRRRFARLGRHSLPGRPCLRQSIGTVGRPEIHRVGQSRRFPMTTA
jgi:membrane-associated phospholipid phosphatase